MALERLSTVLFASLLALSAAGCARKPKEVHVTPARTVIYGLKRTFVMTAKVTDTKGREITSAQVEWSSEREKTATVDRTSGVVTAVSPGKTAIVATYQKLVGKAGLEVVDAASITVSPLRMTIAGPPGTTGAFRAEVKSSRGALVDARPRWSSSDVKVATANIDGIVTSVGPGRTTIAATLGDIANAADLTVTVRPVAQFGASPHTLILRVGDVQGITPAAFDDSGREIPDPAVEWVSSDPKTAKVIEGKVTGLAAGAATIHATSGTRTAEVSVLVN